MRDAELLERFVLARDEEAFEALVLRHGPMVLSVCRHVLSDAEDAEDAFQATFLTLARHAKSIRKGQAISSWLYVAAYRSALRIRTGNARHRESEGHPVDVGVEVETPGEMSRQETHKIVHDELQRLPEKYRAPIAVCYLEGRSHEEAAHELRWPLGTVKGRLARARELLRSRLLRRGLEFSIVGLTILVARDTFTTVSDVMARTTISSALNSVQCAAPSTARDPASPSRSVFLPSSWLVAGLVLVSALTAVDKIAANRPHRANGTRIVAPSPTAVAVSPEWTGLLPSRYRALSRVCFRRRAHEIITLPFRYQRQTPRGSESSVAASLLPYLHRTHPIVPSPVSFHCYYPTSSARSLEA
jgi:RNA polymerase sigma factor (sigma-70 family)